MTQKIIIAVTAAHFAAQARLEGSPDHDPARHNAVALALNEHLRTVGAHTEGRARVLLHNTCDPDECGCLGLSTVAIGDYWVQAPAIIHRRVMNYTDPDEADPFEFALLDHWRWSKYVSDEELQREALGFRADAKDEAVQKVCATCGGADIVFDATATWCVEAQNWLMGDALSGSFCMACQEDCRVTDAPAARADRAQAAAA